MWQWSEFGGIINKWILIMCALRAHTYFYFWKKNFSRIEKVMATFSFPGKIFIKIKSLMFGVGAK